MNIELNQFQYQFNEKMNIQNIPTIATQRGNDSTLQKEVVEDNFASDFFQHFFDPISLSQCQNRPKMANFHSRGKVASEIGKICSMPKVEMTVSLESLTLFRGFD